MAEQQNIIINKTVDGQLSVILYAKEDMVWKSKNQVAALFGTSKQNRGQHISNLIEDKD